MNWMTFIAASLCVWRLSKMVTEEEGPFMIFVRIRASFPLDGKHGWIGRGLHCLWCMSFWFGLAVGIGLPHNVLNAFIFGLAFSATAIAFDSFLEYALQKMRSR